MADLLLLDGSQSSLWNILESMATERAISGSQIYGSQQRINMPFIQVLLIQMLHWKGVCQILCTVNILKMLQQYTIAESEKSLEI